MKTLLVNELELEENIDADDYGSRLVKCVESLSDNVNVINLIKVKMGPMSHDTMRYNIDILRQLLNDKGCTNFIIVPTSNKFDLSVEYVLKEETNDVTENN